jgi:hypothetical protein
MAKEMYLRLNEIMLFCKQKASYAEIANIKSKTSNRR